MSPVRYGVIGVGGIGDLHLRFASEHPQAKIAAVVDHDADLVAHVAGRLGVPGFTDYRDMLAAGLVDAVSIATPHHLLAPIGLACLAADVHVMLEKPFATKSSDADALLASAAASSLKIAAAYQYWTYDSARRIKDALDSGTIGNPLRILWTWLEYRPDSYYRRDAWRSTWTHAGGGVLLNQASHDLHLLDWLIGPATEVSAMVGNQFRRGSVEDIACANIRYANGALASFQSTINQPGGMNVRQIAGDRGTIDVRGGGPLIGGAIEIVVSRYGAESLHHWNHQIAEHHGQPPIDWETTSAPQSIRRIADHVPASIKGRLRSRLPSRRSRPFGHRFLINDFIDAILTDSEPVANARRAARTVEVVDALILSAFHGRAVSLPVERSESDRLHEQLSDGSMAVPGVQCSERT